MSDASHGFTPVPVVGRGLDQSVPTLLTELDSWTRSEPIVALVEEFGGTVPTVDLAARLEFLDAFSEEWDYRGKASRSGRAAERNQAIHVTFSTDRDALVMEAMAALGLTTTNRPRYDSYQHVLVNGALVRYSIWRMAYAGHLIREGLHTDTVAALTAYRAMARNEARPEIDEFNLLAKYGLPKVANEAEMMEFLLQREFDLGALRDQKTTITGAHTTRFAVRSTERNGTRFDLVAAPDPTTAARARTGDTMQFWAREVVELEPGDRVLSISSSIYGPFQHAAALQHLTLPFQADVDTVAIDFDAIPPEPARYSFTPAQYLQETRSTIRAYRELHSAIVSTQD